jgi:uncharacterized SAM-binding protein YcdF (DUF218 family)
VAQTIVVRRLRSSVLACLIVPSLAGHWRTVRAVLAAIGLLFLLIICTPVVQWTAKQLAVDWSDQDADTLVLLLAETVSLDEPGGFTVAGPSSYWRAVYTLYVWRRGHFRKLLLSGRGSREAKLLLLAGGIPEEAMMVEDRSLSTRENALYAKSILATLPGKAALVTSDFHMYRSLRTFARLGMRLAPRPAPDLLKIAADPRHRWWGFCALAGELTKIAWYRAHGWM